MWQGNQGGYTEDYDSSRKIRPFVIIISIWCFGCVRVFGILGVCIWYFGVCIWYLGVCIWYLVLCVCVRGGGGSLFFRYVKVMQWNSIKLKEWYFVKIYFWWKQYFSSLRHRFFWSHLEIVLTLWHKKMKKVQSLQSIAAEIQLLMKGGGYKRHPLWPSAFGTDIENQISRSKPLLRFLIRATLR